jgi:uncharacterized protein YjiS (DUF1127 family)
MRSITTAVTALAAFVGSLIWRGVVPTLKNWWRDRDKSRRALAALDHDQLADLSEIGRRMWSEGRRTGQRSSGER